MTTQTDAESSEDQGSASSHCSSSLVDRLRGIYTMDVNDGAGLLNGKDKFTRVMEGLPPIQAEAANRIEELEQQLAVAEERIESFEALASWAITTEVKNTNSWMRGFVARVNGHLIREGDARRCIFDGQQLRLRNVTQCIPNED